MTSVDEMVIALSQRIGTLPSGSLSVFGDVFGGRIDNWHTVTASRTDAGSLLIDFDGGETLRVWAPDGLTATPEELSIRRADRVRWEWFYYGREHVAENRYFIEHVREGDHISVTTDAGWASRAFSPSPRRPAVEILGM